MEKKGDIKIVLLIILIILFVICSIILVFIILSLNKPSLPIIEQNVTTPNIILGIKSAQIIPGNKTININVTRSGKGDLIQISFIFIDIDGMTFSYNETNSNNLPMGNETKNYKITSDMVYGLRDFSKVKSVLISYLEKRGGESRIAYSSSVNPGFIVPSQTQPPSPGSGGGGGGGGSGGGGGGGGNPTPTCNPSKTCADYFGQCGIGLSDGCSNSLNCSNNCASGQSCNSNGQCVSSSTNNNLKLMSKYSSKEAFLISDKNWRDVLPLVPLTTWTGSEADCQRGYGTPSDVCVYPTLIWHEEEVGSNNISLDRNVLNLFSFQINSSDLGFSSSYADVDTLNKNDNFSLFISIGKNNPYDGIPVNFDSIKLTNYKNYFRLNSPSFINNIGVTINNKDSYTVQFNFTFIGFNYSFDADSIIYFMQQYNSSRLTIIGNTTGELDNLLIAAPELGAGLNINQIQRITSNDYFSYWANYSSIVYVEDNYELSLLASSYASLVNTPLVIKNTSSDVANVFINKKVICVGNVVPSGNFCNESYSLESLQSKYVNRTNTDKIILVNPDDLNISISEQMQPEKSNGYINNIYTKDSLISPLLSGAKRELIISIINFTNNYSEVKRLINNKINETRIHPNYLTILSNPYLITDKYSINHYINDADSYAYSSINNDSFLELNTGRIYGISISDISSYISRVIFYNQLPRSNNFSMLYYDAEFPNQKQLAKANDKILSALNYTNQSVYTDDDNISLNVVRDMKNKFYINYLDHGGPFGWMEIESSSLRNIWLSPSIVVSDACSTCSFVAAVNNKRYLWCTNILRKGGLMHIGAIDLAMGTDEPSKIFLENMIGNIDIGKAFKNFKNLKLTDPNRYMLLGDPSFNLGLSYTEPQKRLIKTVTLDNNSTTIYLEFPERIINLNKTSETDTTYIYEPLFGKELFGIYINVGKFSGVFSGNVQNKIYLQTQFNGLQLDSNLSKFVIQKQKQGITYNSEEIEVYNTCKYILTQGFIFNKCLDIDFYVNKGDLFLNIIEDFNGNTSIYIKEFYYLYSNESIPAYNYTIKIPLRSENNSCYDYTSYNQCSSEKPKYCQNGLFIDNCTICGCPSYKYNCLTNGTCEKI